MVGAVVFGFVGMGSILRCSFFLLKIVSATIASAAVCALISGFLNQRFGQGDSTWTDLPQLGIFSKD
jgi:hypothetical protein